MTKKRKTVRIVKWVRVLVLIMIISLITCAIILTLALTATNSGNLLVSERRFYMVATSRNTSLTYANRDAVALRTMGGAGFVLNNQDAFYTIAAVYASHQDALAVANRLSLQEGFSASVFVRVSPRITKRASCENEAEVFSTLLVRPLELIESLTTLSLDLSANSVTDSHALWLLNSKRSGLLTLSTYIANLDNNFIFAKPILNEFYTTMLTAFTNASALNFSSNLSVNILHLVPLIIEAYHNTVSFLS